MSTNISWTDVTWNPVTGCSKVSAGCANCYAARQAPRLAAMGQKGYTSLPWTARNASENVMLHEDRLDKPLRWRKPRRVFVNSMSDLFHELVPYEFIDKVFAVMSLAPQHTFQVLTKRPERMAAYFNDERHGASTATYVEAAKDILSLRRFGAGQFLGEWPLPNVHLGTSVEDQRAADERIPHLLRTPAAVRFLSCEPLIRPVDLTDVHRCGTLKDVEPGVDLDYDVTINALTGRWFDGWDGGTEARLHWVIAGGESGPGFRPMDLDWARSLRDQCVASDVAFWFKQGSGLRPETNALLDGEEWRQFPEDGCS